MRSKLMLISLVLSVAAGNLMAGGGSRAPIAYPPQTASVGTTSTMILPPIGAARGTNEWSTPTTNAYGDYLTVFETGKKEKYYWCVGAGTNGVTEPTWITTGDITDGAATWRYINPVRNAYDIRNWGSGKASFSFGGETAIINSGQTVPGSGNGAIQGGFNGRPCFQGAINCISEALYTNTISIHEE